MSPAKGSNGFTKYRLIFYISVFAMLFLLTQLLNESSQPFHLTYSLFLYKLLHTAFFVITLNLSSF